MNLQTLVFALLLAAILLYSKLRRKLTTGGLIAAAVTGILVFVGFGLAGITIIGTFFVLGNVATSWKVQVKQQFDAVENIKGTRDASQVFANGGVAALLGLLCWLDPSLCPTFFLMMAASMASATADTLSSELGTVYGKKFYNVITFKDDVRGENGVISLEGTLFGLAGSTIIALLHYLTIHAQPFDAVKNSSVANPVTGAIIVLTAGTFGNFCDSVLGATLERRHRIKNDGVNFLNTALAAALGWLLFLVLM